MCLLSAKFRVLYTTTQARRTLNLLLFTALAIFFIVLATARYKMHPFLALIAAAFGYGIAVQMPLDDLVKSINTGFGATVGNIGIVIIAGAIIGIFLERSGGALRLALHILRVIGAPRTPLAMSVAGYIVSIPVFCDSAFILLSPIGRALAKAGGTSVAAAAIALSLGLYSTHTMVPPTPGPVGAAGILNADLGLVTLWGLVIAAVAALAGWLFAITATRRLVLEDMPDAVPAPIADTSGAPGTAKTLLPILLPIVLIVLRSIAQLPTKPFGEGAAHALIAFAGQPIVALLLGALLAFLLPKRFDRAMLSGSGWVGEAIVSAAPIIIITGAGGAFGKVLENSGIGDVIAHTMAGREGIGLWLPFLIAAGLKTAQGSSTVAMITTAGLIAPMMGSLGLDSAQARALTTVAIGAGAMMVSHANDSYFWVVTQFSRLTLAQGYRLQTLGTLVQGLAAAAAIAVAGWLVL